MFAPASLEEQSCGMHTSSKVLLALLVAPMSAGAQSASRTRIDSTVASSPSVRSTLQARAILTNAISAAGGLSALRALTSISTDRSTLRTTLGQGLRPSVPSVSRGVQLARLDLRARRAFTLRDQEIDGGQMLATGIVVTPDTGFDINYPNRTYYSRTSAQYGNARVDLLRGEVPTVLLAAWNRLEQARSMGRTTIRGRACDGIAFADADGSLVTLYFDAATHRLARSEFVADDAERGDAAVTTDYGDYRAAGALTVPFRTTQDGPGVQRLESTIDRIELNAPLADSLFAVPGDMEKASFPAPIRKVADGVYGLQATLAVEFRDFVVVFDAYTDNRRSIGNIARLRSAIPSKPIRYVISSHYHHDHLGGSREYAALGANFITTRDAVEPLRDILRARHALRPDSLSIAPMDPAIDVVDSVRIIDDGTRRLELYQIGPTAHVDRILIGYLPKERILIEADLFDAPFGRPAAGGEDTQQLVNKIRALHLDPTQILPVHGSPTPVTMQDLERAVAMHRARANCAPALVTRLFCPFWRTQSVSFEPFPPGTEQLYHFDFSRTLFASPEAERAERTTALALAARAADLAPNAASSAKSLLSMLRTADSAELQLGRHYGYLTLLPEVDRRNTSANGEYAQLATTAQQSLGRVSAVLASMEETRLQSFAREEPALSKYLFAVRRARVLAPPNTSDPRTSQLLQTIFAGPQRFAAVNRAIDWGTISSPEGPLEIRGKMGYILAHRERSVREAGFRRNTAALATRRDTFADIITSVAKARNELSRSRGFPDYREESYGQGALSVGVIHHILTALRDASSENREIERLRKAIIRRKFGYADVHWWDLTAPSPGQPLPRFRFDEATAIALDAAKPIGPSYVAELAALLDPRNGRLDVAPAPFKSEKPGFATGTVGYPSRFFMSHYTGLIGDLSILVHEAGHAAQNMMMDRAGVLPRYATGPSYFTESYATLSQYLLLEHLARSASDTALKVFYMERLLEQGADLYRNGFEAMLEDSLYVLVRQGQKPSADEIERLHQGIASQFSDWYGPGSDITLGWVQPLQFYTWPLYRINYVMANLLALNYVQQLKADAAGFQRRYQSLLSRGYDATPAELLQQEMGIDINDPQKLIATAVGVLRQWKEELRAYALR